MSQTTLAGIVLCLSLAANVVYQIMTGHSLDAGLIAQLLAAVSALRLGVKAADATP